MLRLGPLVALLIGLLAGPTSAQSPAQDRADALGIGINVSWLEQYWLGTPDLSTAPLWAAEFARIAEFGFQHVRLPIVFDVYADTEPPYTIDPAIWAVVDDVVATTRDLGLMLVLDNHHGRLEDTNFEEELPRHVAILAQLAERYADTDPDRVLLELYNEPHDLSNERWHTFLRAAIDTMRQAAPTHTLVYGGINYNGVEGLELLDPTLDDNVVYALHIYDPLIFTHQGAGWVQPEAATTGIPFPYDAATMPPLAAEAVGTDAEFLYAAYPEQGTPAYVRGRVERAVAWAQTHAVPVWLGEFGTLKFFADNESRVIYTQTLVDAARDTGMSYAYWEWNEGFGVFDGPPTLPMNVDDANERLLSALGVTVVSEEGATPPVAAGLQVYPNPSAGRLVLEGERLERGGVFDVLGRQVATFNARGAARFEVTLPSTPGVYVLRVATADGTTTQRVVRQ
ncbi:MAG: cellulase family glycosylhydrolase [Bacteroidota bacterium]